MTMLRDLNISNGGNRDSSDPRVGVLASEIPTGQALPAFLLNDIDSEFPNRLYSLEILTLPSAGVLYLDKTGTGTFTGAPDGVYSGTQRVQKFDPGTGLVSNETGTYSITVGATAGINASVNVIELADGVVSSGTVSVSVSVNNTELGDTSDSSIYTQISVTFSATEAADTVEAYAGQTANTVTINLVESADSSASQITVQISASVNVSELSDSVNSSIFVETLNLEPIVVNLSITELPDGLTSYTIVYTPSEGSNLPNVLVVKFKNPKYKITFNKR